MDYQQSHYRLPVLVHGVQKCWPYSGRGATAGQWGNMKQCPMHWKGNGVIPWKWQFCFSGRESNVTRWCSNKPFLYSIFWKVCDMSQHTHAYMYIHIYSYIYIYISYKCATCNIPCTHNISILFRVPSMLTNPPAYTSGLHGANPCSTGCEPAITSRVCVQYTYMYRVCANECEQATTSMCLYSVCKYVSPVCQYDRTRSWIGSRQCWHSPDNKLLMATRHMSVRASQINGNTSESMLTSLFTIYLSPLNPLVNGQHCGKRSHSMTESRSMHYKLHPSGWNHQQLSSSKSHFVVQRPVESFVFQ